MHYHYLHKFPKIQAALKAIELKANFEHRLTGYASPIDAREAALRYFKPTYCQLADALCRAVETRDLPYPDLTQRLDSLREELVRDVFARAELVRCREVGSIWGYQGTFERLVADALESEALKADSEYRKVQEKVAELATNYAAAVASSSSAPIELSSALWSAPPPFDPPVLPVAVVPVLPIEPLADDLFSTAAEREEQHERVLAKVLHRVLDERAKPPRGVDAVPTEQQPVVASEVERRAETPATPAAGAVLESQTERPIAQLLKPDPATAPSVDTPTVGRDRLPPLATEEQRRAAVKAKLARVSQDAAELWRYDADFWKAAKVFQSRKTFESWLKNGPADASAHQAFCRVLLMSSTEFVAARQQWQKKPKRASQKKNRAG